MSRKPKEFFGLCYAESSWRLFASVVSNPSSHIVDFFCPSAKLIIELDGGQHGMDEIVAYDETRTRFLEKNGYRVLRFWNGEVMTNRDVIAEAICRAAQPSP